MIIGIHRHALRVFHETQYGAGSETDGATDDRTDYPKDDGAKNFGAGRDRLGVGTRIARRALGCGIKNFAASDPPGNCADAKSSKGSPAETSHHVTIGVGFAGCQQRGENEGDGHG